MNYGHTRKALLHCLNDMETLALCPCISEQANVANLQLLATGPGGWDEVGNGSMKNNEEKGDYPPKFVMKQVASSSFHVSAHCAFAATKSFSLDADHFGSNERVAAMIS